MTKRRLLTVLGAFVAILLLAGCGGVESGARPVGQPMTKQDAPIATALEKVMGSQFAGM